ncbi:MAG: hypothetical protein RMM53_08665 [Bacteroidia bacterium]|nr:hypothetical protein [Bacteroidia bacterium]MDW8334271.1 hypothetical protein [Bacteroidia bacterium]
MEDLTAIHWSAFGLCFGVAPALYGLSVLLKGQYSEILIAWRRQQADVVLTILAFIVNLNLFIIGFFFLASCYGDFDVWRVNRLSREQLEWLALDCVLAMAGVIQLFFAAQNYVLQFITTDGVVLAPFAFWLPPDKRIIPWHRIKDFYYPKECPDYPVIQIHLIVQDLDGYYRRRTIKAPMYVLKDLEMALNAGMEKKLTFQQRRNKWVRREKGTPAEDAGK